ncbi:hypothetical protein PHYPO_G00140040 [Pangasianodon hypophthalmus]|uniref:Uncharacterized protein n=1 Tax=Pangasianodon hypophthalmus TaxID=310915 RepID=A0A5N5KC19_PANHP|nr:hypothetical protein PHYPO_G00140040 [Pangasianodon hypophthalmus]
MAKLLSGFSGFGEDYHLRKCLSTQCCVKNSSCKHASLFTTAAWTHTVLLLGAAFNFYNTRAKDMWM